jgi:hypothetical protein
MADELILPNLRVMVGGAKYGSPTIQKIITIENNLISINLPNN